MSSRGDGPAFAGAMRFLMTVAPAPSYLLAPDRTLVHANVHALGEAGALDECRLREVAELTRPLAAPPGVRVHHIEGVEVRGHLVVDLRAPVILDSAARAFAELHGFSPKHTEVFVLWMRDLSEGEIARALGRSIETVRTHLRIIRFLSGLSGKVELMNAVRRLAGR